MKIYNKAEILEVEDKYEQYHLESMLLIAEEYGFNDVKSMFVISVIDKTFSRVGLIEFSVMLKNKFGENNILILLVKMEILLPELFIQIYQKNS